MMLAVFLVLLTLAAAAAAVDEEFQSEKETNAQPNIIYILVDDFDFSLLPAMPLLRRHVIEQGTTFETFMYNTAVCGPSRSTILTGRLVHNTRVYNNSLEDSFYVDGPKRDPTIKAYIDFVANGQEDSTIATTLQTLGYHTFFAGKYINGYPDTEADSTNSTKTRVPVGWEEWYSPVAGNGYEGFNVTLNENGKLVKYGDAPEDYMTDVFANKTLEFLQKKPQPFFAYVSTFTPHAPFVSAPRHRGLFADAVVPPTENYNETDMSDKPLFVQRCAALSDKVAAEADEEFRMRLECVQSIDEMIDAVVAKLVETNMLENTYVFFSSDNGWHQGSHRITHGKNTIYEEASHGKLFVTGPFVRRNHVVPRNYVVGTVDLAATWSDLAGLPYVDRRTFLDGRSLVPFLDETKALPGQSEWREYYMMQKGEPFSQPLRNLKWNNAGCNNPTGQFPNYVALRSSTHTYVEYQDGEVELYNLDEDYEQLNNINAADPDTVEKLHDVLSRLKTCAGSDCRLNDAAVGLK